MYLPNDKLGHTPLESITSGGGNDISDALKKLIDVGANINATTKNGWTPLHNAVAYLGSAQTILKMLVACANVNVKDKKGITPLMLAVRKDKPQLAKLFIQAGPNVNETTEDKKHRFLWRHVAAVKIAIRWLLHFRKSWVKASMWHSTAVLYLNTNRVL